MLVSVDPSGSTSTVEWAAAEAAARGCDLNVVHTYTPALTPDVFGFVPMGFAVAALRDAAQRVLDDAVLRARAIAPDLSVTGQLQAGESALGILRQLDDHALIVLDRNAGRGSWAALLSGSLWRGLVRNTDVPVILVGALGSADGPSAGMVVVAAEPGGPPPAVRSFAAEEARRRGVGVCQLDDRLGPSALARDAMGAALLVVGVSRARARRTRILVRAVSTTPVALVRRSSTTDPSAPG